MAGYILWWLLVRPPVFKPAEVAMVAESNAHWRAVEMRGRDLPGAHK